MQYKRKFPDWLTAYLNYTSYSESPKHMHFWVGVSAIAGALRRKVWIDQLYYKWYPNFYIIMVAPPGIVAKSTTSGIGMSILREVPDIRFGPDVITWQALITALAENTEMFEYPANSTMYYPMSAITLESSEFGNLFDPSDREMVDMFVSLWDGKEGGFSKKTKSSGSDIVENPWINIIACTTPAWIAGNFPDYLIGGGFTSRCIFVYADQKAQYNAYPRMSVPAGMVQHREDLLDDLKHIAAHLCGEYQLTKEALEWGVEWYEHHHRNKPVHLDDDRFGGYLARKQTHVHKLAMILAASSSDELIITRDCLQTAVEMVSDLEVDMVKVFSKIGNTESASHLQRLLNYIAKQGIVSYKQAYKFAYVHFTSAKAFEDAILGCIKSGQLAMTTTWEGEQQVVMLSVPNRCKEKEI